MCTGSWPAYCVRLSLHSLPVSVLWSVLCWNLKNACDPVRSTSFVSCWRHSQDTLSAVPVWRCGWLNGLSCEWKCVWFVKQYGIQYALTRKAGRGSMRCPPECTNQPLHPPTLQLWHGSISPVPCSGSQRADTGCSETACYCCGQLNDGRHCLLDAVFVREEMAIRPNGRSCLVAWLRIGWPGNRCSIPGELRDFSLPYRFWDQFSVLSIGFRLG
jgi:hypothetical protein